MTYVVLARKWRPQRFSDLIGQETITRTLSNAIELGRVSHALLMTGARGVGKTTSARILAKALNCEKGPTVEPCDACSNCHEIAAGTSVDVIEVDGASNTSVDDVRELRENVRYRPSKSRNKIYIIDEVHMLSTSAFNALLKTLEEPPPGVMFIFATTEPQKIPDTILSRCQRFDFKQLSEDQIAKHLRRIVDAEKIEVGDDALRLVARQASGSVRDSLSLLDQVIAFTGNKVQFAEVVSILGLTDRELIWKTLEAFCAHDGTAALAALGSVLEKGFDPKSYLTEVWERVRDLLVLRSGASEELVQGNKDEKERLKSWAKDLDEAELERWFDVLKDTIREIGRAEFPRYLLEVALLKIARTEPRMPLRALVERLESLEKKLADPSYKPTAAPTGGARVPAPATPVVKSSPAETPVAKGPKQVANWDTFVAEMKRRKPAFAANLLQVAKAGIEGSKILLTYEEGSYLLSRAKDKDFQDYLVALATELFGGDYSVDVDTTPKMSSGKATKGEESRAREREALGNSVVQKALSLFDARIEEVKPVK